MEPELRTNTGEIEAAQKNKLPKLIGYNDIKGDLQIQTTWTDGLNSIEDYVKEAMKLGLEYIAITDHTKTLTIAGGLDERGLARQSREIDKLNLKLKIKNLKFRILKSAEVNILKDGKLDIKDETLKKLDVVAVGVHSGFKMSKKEMTERIIRAMKNPYTDILFHPTGRVINRRPPYQIDIEKIIRAAKETKTVLEINAYPDRLDLKDEHARMAKEAGVKIVIDSDAHNIHHLHYLEFGIAQARRGWAEKKDIINAWPVEKMLRFLR
jgi:DNA polymerase (family 10)